jgi:hypothetical protein
MADLASGSPDGHGDDARLQAAFKLWRAEAPSTPHCGSAMFLILGDIVFAITDG